MEGADKKMYDICNDSNPATQGIAYSEYLGVIGVFMQKFGTIKAETEAAAAQ